MAKDIRIITASANMAALVDNGADVDTEIKNLTYEDKGIKNKIVEGVAGEFQEGEKSIRVEGTTARAVVTVVKSFEIDAGRESFPSLRKAVDGGLLADVVQEKRTLVVPPDDAKRAADVLVRAGINATVKTSMEVESANADEFRRRGLSSPEENDARDALNGCLVEKTAHRVKYERRG